MDDHLPYLTLLAITVAHHHEVATAETPERTFEAIVNEVMQGRGLLSVDTGQLGRGQGDFRQLVKDVAANVELIANPDAAPSRTRANEEGVDTVSHLSWGDTRPGHWVFIGQATCAQSGEWSDKISEPKPDQWGPLLTCLVNPVAYLAVPHHVEDRHLHHLTHNHAKLVLDRLRLTRHIDALSSTQLDILTRVRAEEVFHPLRG